MRIRKGALDLKDTKRIPSNIIPAEVISKNRHVVRKKIKNDKKLVQVLKISVLTTTVDLPQKADQTCTAFHYQRNFVHLVWPFERESVGVTALDAAVQDGGSEVLDDPI